ncbi:outer membrane beta-barrel protein, partial [Winogradskyella poriferorum]|uniref:outer membrane beta-barrel protein n=1 Tax=Winogradskyella poriferorum TaxID=307627 RepID=UPI003D650324
EDILVTKPINIDAEDRIGIEISMSYNPFKWMQLSGELNYFGFEQKGVYNNVNFDFEDSRWFTRINSRFKLPSDIT